MKLRDFIEQEVNELEDKIRVLQTKTSELLRDGQAGSGEYLRLCGMEQAYSWAQANLVMKLEKLEELERAA